MVSSTGDFKALSAKALNKPILELSLLPEEAPKSTAFQKASDKECYKKHFLYEGEFWNNTRHGTGKLMTQEGNFYFGQFTDGKEDGIGYSFMRQEGCVELNHWVNG
jgi:hypothetical protein